MYVKCVDERERRYEGGGDKQELAFVKRRETGGNPENNVALSNSAILLPSRCYLLVFSPCLRK